jgi:hypothetical protein
MQEDIDKLIELTEENNRLIKTLITDLRWRQLYSLVKWVIIIAIVFGTYAYLQPYLNKTLEMYKQIQGVDPASFLKIK